MMQGVFAPIHTMGKPVLSPPPPAHVEMGKMKKPASPKHWATGQISRPEQNVEPAPPFPDKPYDLNDASAKDNTDEAILKPRTEE